MSEYTLRAARQADDPSLIALEVRSIMRGAALNASNMENYSLIAQSTHVPGKLGGPVVDSPRQLWSVAGYLDMVVRGVFGLEDDGRVAPELPASLVPMLFGSGRRISLYLDGQRIILERPASLDGALLIGGNIKRHDGTIEVQLVPTLARTGPPPLRSSTYGLAAAASSPRSLRGAGIGPATRVAGPWPRHWTAPRRGEYLAWLDYSNHHGPINTGITAAVRRLDVRCGDQPRQVMTLVMPQSEGWQASTTVRFAADAGASCAFALRTGFNMSDLAHFAHYTGGQGGAAGPVSGAAIGALGIAPLPPQR